MVTTSPFQKKGIRLSSRIALWCSEFTFRSSNTGHTIPTVDRTHQIVYSLDEVEVWIFSYPHAILCLLTIRVREVLICKLMLFRIPIFALLKSANEKQNSWVTVFLMTTQCLKNVYLSRKEYLYVFFQYLNASLSREQRIDFQEFFESFLHTLLSIVSSYCSAYVHSTTDVT